MEEERRTLSEDGTVHRLESQTEYNGKKQAECSVQISLPPDTDAMEPAASRTLPTHPHHCGLYPLKPQAQTDPSSTRRFVTTTRKGTSISLY